MTKLSAVIITFNEERNIVRCLESLQGIADEIVVVDSYSTDQTEELCKKFEVRFIKHSFEGHIQQKSWAARQASYDMVLSLDADEALSEELQKSIMEVRQNLAFDAFSFNRLNNYMGKWIRHCGWYPDVKLRMWNRSKGDWGGKNPHDKVIMQPGTSLKHLKGDLLHYSYFSTEQHLNQLNKFTEIAAREAVASNVKSSLLKAIFKSIWKFKRDYFLKLGFLDGYYGFIVCYLSAHAVFIKYLKIAELSRKK